MADNRDRQQAFQIVILLELACRNGGIWFRDSDELDWFKEQVLRNFPFTKDQLGAHHSKSRQPVLENDVMWARKQLAESGDIHWVPREHFDITDNGRERLRAYIHALLASLNETQLKEFIHSQTSAANTVIVNLMQRLDQDELQFAVNASSDCRDVFLNSLLRVSLEHCGYLFSDSSNALDRILMPYLMKEHPALLDS